ncbi:MAG: MFS transporter [Prevotella sp.]|nr:MFS transporter [Prevotella sp.]
MKEKLWNGNYWKVMIANFTLFFAFYLLTPLLPLYLSEQFHATKDVIGVVLSGYTVMALLSRPFSGYLVDTFNRKTVLIVCFFLFFIFFAGYLAASTLLLFTIVRTLHGAPFGSVTVANSTMAIDVLPSSRRNEGIGYYGLSNNLAMAIAPTAGLFIYHEIHNFELLFWLALLIAGIGLLVDASLSPCPSPAGRGEKESLPYGGRLEGAPFISLDRFFLINGWMLAVNMVFFGFCFGVLSNYLAIYCKEVMGRTGGTGVYFALLSVGLIASRLQGSKGLREGKLSRNAAEGVVLSALGYTLFVACPNDFGYYTSALLIGLGNGHMWPAFQNMIINVASHNQRGTANSTILVSWVVGMGLGVLIGGVASEYLGYVEAFWIAASVQIMGTLLFLMKTRGFFEARRLR